MCLDAPNGCVRDNEAATIIPADDYGVRIPGGGVGDEPIEIHAKQRRQNRIAGYGDTLSEES